MTQNFLKSEKRETNAVFWNNRSEFQCINKISNISDECLLKSWKKLIHMLIEKLKLLV